MSPIVFLSPQALTVAAIVGCLAALITGIRQARVGICLVIGAALLVLATGEPAWQSAGEKTAAVMVDMSPSTRGATYRDPAALRRRLQILLPGVKFRLFAFGATTIAAQLNGAALPEMPCDHTVFSPPPAAAIVLFSDGRFAAADPPAPVYPVIDPLLDDPPDAAITAIDVRAGKLEAAARNNAPVRMLTLATPAGTINKLVRGNQTVAAPAPPGGQVIAQLSPGDDWPENDSVSLIIPAQANTQRWWLGADGPPGWQNPPALPANARDYLSPGVIVLNNIAAAAIAPAAQDRLQQYVRDLGGALVILGGDHAFSAGGYSASALDPLSPLASNPPAPAQGWILLADASGSMAADGRWQAECAAITKTLAALPPNDPVRMGQFSDSLKWWAPAAPAREVATLHFPPPDAIPHGPTNLESALSAIARQPGGLSTHLILLTDADVALDHPQALADRLRAAHIHLHLLAIAQGKGLAPLTQLAAATSGSVLTEIDPAQWPAGLEKLESSALGDRVKTQPAQLIFSNALAAIPPVQTFLTDSVWLKPGATEAASIQSHPAAAAWQFGAGRVCAVGAKIPGETAAAIAEHFAQKPRDPGMKITWNDGPTATVTIDAKTPTHWLDDLSPRLNLLDDATGEASSLLVPQTAPGLYSLTFQAAGLAAVQIGDQVIDRHSLPRWYPPEFSAVGTDEPALQGLAQRTGGRVINPADERPIDFHWPRKNFPLTASAATAAAGFIIAGCVARRAGR